MKLRKAVRYAQLSKSVHCNVRCGSTSDLGPRNREVRFTPKNRHPSAWSLRSEKCQQRKSSLSFDHLDGAVSEPRSRAALVSFERGGDGRRCNAWGLQRLGHDARLMQERLPRGGGHCRSGTAPDGCECGSWAKPVISFDLSPCYMPLLG